MVSLIVEVGARMLPFGLIDNGVESAGWIGIGDAIHEIFKRAGKGAFWGFFLSSIHAQDHRASGGATVKPGNLNELGYRRDTCAKECCADSAGLEVTVGKDCLHATGRHL